MKRLLNMDSSDSRNASAQELLQAIKANEGRTIVSECVAGVSAVDGLTTAEVATAFGADLILLNALDVFHPEVNGLGGNFDPSETLSRLFRLIGRPIGVNLEPVDNDAALLSQQEKIPVGRTANRETFEQLARLGAQFVCLTGNPGTGVTNQRIVAVIEEAKKYFNGFIIAGKMHSAGVEEPVMTTEVAQTLISAGTDVLLVPAVGTVPGFRDETLAQIVELAHHHDVLVMSAIGTSQEGASERVIEALAIRNKILGVDLQHIGDAAWGVVSPIHTLYPLSTALRGERHTLRQMARSVNR